MAIHSSMRVLGLSILTDDCFPDALKPVNSEEIIAVAEAAEPLLSTLVTKVVGRIG